MSKVEFDENDYVENFKKNLRAMAYNRLVKPRKPKPLLYEGPCLPISIIDEVLGVTTKSIKDPFDIICVQHAQYLKGSDDD